MSVLLKALLIGAALYACLVAVLASFSACLWCSRATWWAQPPPLPEHTERLTLPIGDAMLHGVRIPGRDPSRPTILGFPGNAWNAEAMALFLHQIAPVA